MAGGLLTDLYELNMAASYLRRGMTGPATFSLFVRRLPADRGFLVAAGLEDGLRFLEEFSFPGGDLAYLRREQGYGEDALRAFEGLRFTGEVWAVPEGRVVFAGEPLLEVTAPIAEAQLAETVLLNHVTFQTSVATKAARCVRDDHERTGGHDIGPPGRQREQHTILVVQMDPVLAPVLAVRDELEVLAEQRIEPVRHPHTPVPIIRTGVVDDVVQRLCGAVRAHRPD